MRTLTLAVAILAAWPTFALAQAPAGGPAPQGQGQGQGRGGGAGGAAGAGQGRGGGAPAAPAGPVRRGSDGKPDLNGHFMGDNGGANWGLRRRPNPPAMWPATRGVIVDPPDGSLPMQEWAQKEQADREQAHRGYDDPTAHCFVAGIPRSMWTPSPYHFVHTPTHLVMLFERMSWRRIPIDPNARHLPDTMRLWQGDSIARWDGDTLVISTRNLNGKPWLNEIGEVLTHQATTVERLTPVDADTITYEVTITDPGAYTRPFTVRFPLRRQADEILEVACHEDNQDLEHLKHARDEWRAKQKQQ